MFKKKKVCMDGKVPVSLFKVFKLNIEFDSYFCKLGLEQEIVVRASAGCSGQVGLAVSVASHR